MNALKEGDLWNKPVSFKGIAANVVIPTSAAEKYWLFERKGKVNI